MQLQFYVNGWPYLIEFKGSLEIYWLQGTLCISGNGFKLREDKETLQKDQEFLTEIRNRMYI